MAIKKPVAVISGNSPDLLLKPSNFKISIYIYTATKNLSAMLTISTKAKMRDALKAWEKKSLHNLSGSNQQIKKATCAALNVYTTE